MSESKAYLLLQNQLHNISHSQAPSSFSSQSQIPSRCHWSVFSSESAQTKYLFHLEIIKRPTSSPSLLVINYSYVIYYLINQFIMSCRSVARTVLLIPSVSTRFTHLLHSRHDVDVVIFVQQRLASDTERKFCAACVLQAEPEVSIVSHTAIAYRQHDVIEKRKRDKSQHSRQIDVMATSPACPIPSFYVVHVSSPSAGSLFRQPPTCFCSS